MLDRRESGREEWRSVGSSGIVGGGGRPVRGWRRWASKRRASSVRLGECLFNTRVLSDKNEKGDAPTQSIARPSAEAEHKLPSHPRKKS